MIKVYKKLTKDQKERNIVFYSCLSVDGSNEDALAHEVKRGEENANKKIKRLKDDKWFNDSPWNYNIIRI